MIVEHGKNDMLDTYVAAIIDRAEALLAERDGALNKKQREVLKTIIASAERFFLSYAHRSALAPGEFFFKMRLPPQTFSKKRAGSLFDGVDPGPPALSNRTCYFTSQKGPIGQVRLTNVSKLLLSRL